MEKRNTKGKDKRLSGFQDEFEELTDSKSKPNHSTTPHRKKPRRQSSSSSSMQSEDNHRKKFHPKRQSSDEDDSDQSHPPKDDKRPQGPPLGPDGKPLPPPPIIGPDGKEIPRPTDAEGRPLAIYITKDGKPLLDKEGKPRPIIFDKDGKPLPPPELQSKSNPPATSSPSNAPIVTPGVKPAAAKKEKEPSMCLFGMGVIDGVISLIIVGFIIEKLASPPPEYPGRRETKTHLVMSLVCLCAGAISAICLVLGVHMKKWKLVYTWMIVASLVFCIQIVIFVVSDNNEDLIVLASIWTVLRFLVASGAGCCNCCCQNNDNYNQSTIYNTSSNYGALSFSGQQPMRTYPAGGYPTGGYQTGGYPTSGGVGGKSTVIVQQVPVPVMAPPMYGGYGYGMPYGGYGYSPYGGYGYGNDAFLMGAMMGGGMYGGGLYGGGMYCDDMYW